MEHPTPLQSSLQTASRRARWAVRRAFATASIGAIGLTAVWFATAGQLATPIWGGLLALYALAVLGRTFRATRRVRSARHLWWAWRHRRAHVDAPGAPLQIAAESPSRRAVRVLADGLSDAPLAESARVHGFGLADRLDELKGLLGDADLLPSLRRPLADEAARVEQELEGLLDALGRYAHADRHTHTDLRRRLDAMIEAEALAPQGLLEMA